MGATWEALQNYLNIGKTANFEDATGKQLQLSDQKSKKRKSSGKQKGTMDLDLDLDLDVEDVT